MGLTNEEKIKMVAQNVGSIMSILGVESTESNKDTPMRVAKMYVNELFKNVENNLEELDEQMTLFDAEHGVGVVSVEVPVNSMCEHHLMPFMGTVRVSYKPTDKIIGLSKIPRVVDYFSRKPQLQERLTTNIGEYLCRLLNPEFITVVMEAEHTCVSMRGIKTPCKTRTEWSKGGSEA